tara:strand:+ start:2866 stop:3861 length:996 start_codon:yes stop_codon:yes gene_type:complete
MKTIYFIRHGEGYHNVNNSYHIRAPRLTSKGLNQCDMVKKKLENVKIDVVFVSPLIRALETAFCIFGETSRTICIECIKELISNPCDLRQSKQILVNMFNHVNFNTLYDNYKYNNKESNEQIQNRMKIFLENLRASPFKSIAVVSHSGFLFTFLKKYGSLIGINDIKYMDNCEVNIGVFYNWFRLKCTFKGNNDNLYLNAEKGFVSIFDTHKSWWSAKWREDEFGNNRFQLICMDTGEKENSKDKILSFVDDSIIIDDIVTSNNMCVWEKEYVEGNWFVLNYYMMECLETDSTKTDSKYKLGRLEYDIVKDILYIEKDNSKINTMWKKANI